MMPDSHEEQWRLILVQPAGISLQLQSAGVKMLFEMFLSVFFRRNFDMESEGETFKTALRCHV